MLSVEDRLEIHELVARYNRANDVGTPQEWASTFTPDGVFDSPIIGRHQGTEELVQAIQDLRAQPDYARYSAGQHWTTNIILEGDGDQAQLWANVMLVIPGEPVPYVSVMGKYDDRLKKIEGEWKFSLRRPYDLVVVG